MSSLLDEYRADPGALFRELSARANVDDASLRCRAPLRRAAGAALAGHGASVAQLQQALAKDLGTDLEMFDGIWLAIVDEMFTGWLDKPPFDEATAGHVTRDGLLASLLFRIEFLTRSVERRTEAVERGDPPPAQPLPPRIVELAIVVAFGRLTLAAALTAWELDVERITAADRVEDVPARIGDLPAHGVLEVPVLFGTLCPELDPAPSGITRALYVADDALEVWPALSTYLAWAKASGLSVAALKTFADGWMLFLIAGYGVVELVAMRNAAALAEVTVWDPAPRFAAEDADGAIRSTLQINVQLEPDAPPLGVALLAR